MDLYLQFGYGMKSLAIDLSRAWGGVHTILSPRDIKPEQLARWSNELNRHGVECLFDPQCYFPKTNHKVLSQYDYWNNSLSTHLGSNNDYENRLINILKHYNDAIDSKQFIIPSMMKEFSDSWFNNSNVEALKLVEASRKLIRNKKLLLTLALPSALLTQKEDEIEFFIESAIKYDVDGFYVVPEPPENKSGNYFIDKPLWVSNLMQLCAGLKLAKKKVVVGYSNHQLLCLSVAKVDAVASGTYLNVRRFSNKYQEAEGEIKRKSVWYYCPQALSEYKIPFLDIAFNNGVLSKMRPDETLNNDYIRYLFSGAMPSSTTFNEPLAFKHYLHCLKEQCQNCSRSSFDETVAANEVLLRTAEQWLDVFEKQGVYAQSRSFKDIIDVNRSAIQRLQHTRGFLLKNEWNDL